jgi:hypothetical protein
MKNLKVLFSVMVLITLGLFTSCDISRADDFGPEPGPEPGSGIEELNFFENDMLGKWSRYHSYDGSTMYYIFNDDRTACYWEQVSSSRRDKKSYVHWELVDKGNNNFSIMVKGSESGSLYSIGVFKYAPNELWKGGYSNLKMFRSNTSKECE